MISLEELTEEYDHLTEAERSKIMFDLRHRMRAVSEAMWFSQVSQSVEPIYKMDLDDPVKIDMHELAKILAVTTHLKGHTLLIQDGQANYVFIKGWHEKLIDTLFLPHTRRTYVMTTPDYVYTYSAIRKKPSSSEVVIQLIKTQSAIEATLDPENVIG